MSRGCGRVSTKKRSLRAAFGRVVCAVVVVALAVGMCPAVAFADPTITTKSQVLSTLKTYDKNGYYIVNTMNKAGDDPMVWWSSSDIFGDLDTMVHEECHGLSFQSDWGSQKIYVGGKKSVKVTLTDVFRSKKIARSVPKRLRTSRYSTYIAQPSANLASDVQGAYGLLNEFMAYCWGFNTSVRLYALASKYTCTDEVWVGYLQSSANTALAYVEFRYFIEQYLYYAKNHNKAVYKGIMNNKKFKTAVKKIDRKFAKLIKTYDKRLKKIANKLAAKGYKAEYTNGSFMVWSGMSAQGCGLYIADYNKFVKELNKAKYKSVAKKLGLKNVKKRTVSL